MIYPMIERLEPQIHPIYICTLNVEGKSRHWYADSWYDFIKMWNDGDGPSGEDKLLDFSIENLFISKSLCQTYSDLKHYCDIAYTNGRLG